MFNLNWKGVLLSVVLGSFLGFLWYGVFFLDGWMAGHGFTAEGEGAAAKMFKNGVEVYPQTAVQMTVNAISMAIYAAIMQWLINKTNSNGAKQGALLGLMIGITHLVGIYVSNMFAFVPKSISFIDGSYSLVLYTVIGAVMGYFSRIK